MPGIWTIANDILFHRPYLYSAPLDVLAMPKQEKKWGYWKHEWPSQELSSPSPKFCPISLSISFSPCTGLPTPEAQFISFNVKSASTRFILKFCHSSCPIIYPLNFLSRICDFWPVYVYLFLYDPLLHWNHTMSCCLPLILIFTFFLTQIDLAKVLRNVKLNILVLNKE